MTRLDKMAKYAQASIGEQDYRWTVKGNGDVPGCVDVSADEWSEETLSWSPRLTLECIPLDVLAWLAKQARVVVRIEDGGAK